MSDVTIDVADEEYDFIVVGGGNTGCVVASRLSEDLNTKVLLIEAGESDKCDPNIAIPAAQPSLIGAHVDWNYKTTAQKRAFGQDANKVSHYAMGKVLGGSSSLNAMHYIRGSRHDFDFWEDLGAEGWDFKSVEPIFRKLENAKSKGMSSKYGKDGPVFLTRNYLSKSPFCELMINAASELGYDYGDYTDNMEGLSHATGTVYLDKRQNASTAYVRPHFPARKDRLHILTGAYVTKVLIDQKSATAYAVKYTKEAEDFVIRARKEVILSAGAFSSPHLLMLSGIGSKEELEKFNISVIKDLPGVGSNLQDQMVVGAQFIAENIPFRVQDINPEKRNPKKWRGNDFTDTSLYFAGMSSYFGTSASRSTRERPFPDISLFIKDTSSHDRKLSFGISPLLNHPKSTGTVKLISADPWVLPEVNPKYFSDDDDMKVHIAGFRLLEFFETSKTFKEAGVKFRPPEVCGKLFSENIPRSDAFYRCLIEQTGFTISHACGTAKIGRPDDKYAVVDPKLRVYGIKGLRVADASIMPHIATSTSQGPCYMIGEKAAIMIKEHWDIL